MIAKFFTGKWSSYFSGTVIACFFILTLYILDSPTGMSNAYIMISDYCKESIHARAVQEPPFLDWQTGFLGGIFIGALIAAIFGGDWKLRMIPESSGKGMIASAGITVATGLAGGFLVMLGLQIAGDSFLGQWAGAIQLSTSSWVFFISLLIWGIIFTAIIAAKIAKSEIVEGKSDKGKKEK
jgi:hypothetical protein